MLFMLAFASVTHGIVIKPPSSGVLIPVPGNAKDPYPFVGLVSVDNNPAEPFEPVPTCTGTLIAPTLVVSAAHCLQNIKATNAQSPKAIQVNFGQLGNIMVEKWKMHPNYKKPPGPNPNPVSHDLAWLSLETAPKVTPVPIFRGEVDTGTELAHVGFGFNPLSEPGPKKAWGADKVDAITNGVPNVPDGLVRFNWSGGGDDALTQNGDSGGPGLHLTGNNLGDANTIKGKALQSGAYPSNWDSRGKDVFLASALQGNIGFSQYATPFNERINGKSDINFLLSEMPLPNGASDIKVVHNLSANPEKLPQNAPQGILISARYENLDDFVFSPLIWEEDAGQAAMFDGYMVFGPESGKDDLAGFGYSAGQMGNAGWVHAWAFTDAGSLSQLSEHIFEGSLDWVLEFLTTSGPVTFDLTNSIKPSSLADLSKAILVAKDEINKGTALRGVVDLYSVSEPSTIVIFLLAFLILFYQTRTLAFINRGHRP